MKKLLLTTFVVFLVLGLAGCSSQAKQGKVFSVPVKMSFNDMLDGKANNPVFGDTVTVKTDDGKKYNAKWDAKKLGMPVGLNLTNVSVTIEPTDNPKIWKVTKVLSKK